MSSADNYIYDWLVAYGSLLGPLLGILLADYYVSCIWPHSGRTAMLQR